MAAKTGVESPLQINSKQLIFADLFLACSNLRTRSGVPSLEPFAPHSRSQCFPQGNIKSPPEKQVVSN